MELSYSGSTGAMLKGRHRETQHVAGSSAIKDTGRKITALITEMIAVDMQPLSMVKDVGFNALMAYLEPDYKMPGLKTVMAE